VCVWLDEYIPGWDMDKCCLIHRITGELDMDIPDTEIFYQDILATKTIIG